MEAQAASYADGHIGVARKVEINLECEGDDSYPCASGREGIQAVFKECIGDFRELVGEDYFLSQADQEAERAVGYVGGVGAAVVDFAGDCIVAHDGSGNQLWEHGDIEQQVGVALLGRSLKAVDIDQVGDRLEYVETDADRKSDLRDIDRDSDTVEYLSEKAEILERA